MQIFEVLKRIFLGFVKILSGVKIFGTDLWSLTLGFLVFGFAVSAIRILFFSGGSDDK